MKEQIRKAEPFTCEIYNYKKNGEGYWLRINGQPIFDKYGKVTQFFAIEEDITNVKTAQEKIKSSANRLSSLISNLHAGILLENEDRTIGLINQKFCDLFGIAADPSLLIGADCSKSAEQSKNLFRDPNQFISGINKILSEKILVTGEILEMADGRFLERDFIPIWNEQQYQGHLWMYTDITEKIGLDKKLEEQRIFYEEILDKMPADIAVFDNQHRYLYVNPTGIKDPELRKWMVGKKDEDYIRYRNKPLSILEQRRNLFKQVIATKQLQSWEEEIKQPDNTFRYVLRNIYPILNSKGEVFQVIGYGVDITAIKNIQQQIAQSEKRYRDVIENSLAIVTTHDMEGKFLTVNPMVRKLYGYDDDEVIGHSLMDFIPEEDKEFFHQTYLDKILQEKATSGIFRVLNKNGSIVYSLYNNYLKEEPGMEPYVIGFAVDITDRIKAEKELKIAKKVTEELALTKQNFLANMSHEIRTPMNAIIGMANQLSKTSLSDNQQFYLNVIHSAADNLLIIINDILDLTKIEAGKLSIEKIGFEPKKVVDRAVHVMMHRAEEKGIAFTNSICDSKVSPVLIGDPYRLNQVLLNLLSNSIKFTEKGSVDITCKVLHETKLHQTVQVSIIDTGIGMDESFAKNLFQKFSQEDESVTRKFGGTGLGMSICKELVELMGGTIEVKSLKGKGTTVSFTISFKKGTEADLPVKESETFNANILSGKNILVVDDNGMNRLVATTILKNYGASVEEAQNGKEAIARLQNQPFDIILMDVQMPVMDGIEATREIRKTVNKKVPIIALTAFAIKGDDEKFMNAGMNDYLSKPFLENQLLQVVAKWLGKKVTVKANKSDSVKPGALYDLSNLKAIAKGNDSFVIKMVNLFKEQAPATMDEMEEAYTHNDFEKVNKLAHRLKPSIDNMGITALKEVIREIENNAAMYGASEKLSSLIAYAKDIIHQVVNKV
jgi:PAS domain S-box-containing protein